MSVDLRPRSLSAIAWRPARAALPLAEAALTAKMQQKAATTVNLIVKRRARDMLGGELPPGFCARAAAILARLERAHARRAARRAA
jgi:hypothetical protein